MSFKLKEPDLQIYLNKRTDVAIDNFKKAVIKLEQFLSTPLVDERDKAGVIQAFEFCYELSWNALKKIAEDKGLEAPSPIMLLDVDLNLNSYLNQAKKCG